MSKTIVTSPDEQTPPEFVGGNYHISISGQGNVTKICFLLSNGNALFCFRIDDLFSRNMEGFIDFSSMELNRIYVPPHVPGIIVAKDIFGNPRNVKGFTRIFWDVERKVKQINTKWSSFPTYYSEFGSLNPSISFLVNEGFVYISVGETVERSVLNSISTARKELSAILGETRQFYSRTRRIFQSADANSNAVLSCFLSNSDTVDTHSVLPLASKSPHYYVSAGSWARDLILWNFPCIYNCDPSRGKQVLRNSIEIFMKNPGIHALYVDGRVLYDGFELDQLASIIHGLEIGKVIGVYDEPEIDERLELILEVMKKWKGKNTDLYGTELNSSDDPVSYPYVTYNNALLSTALLRLGKVVGESSDVLQTKGKKIRDSIFEKLVVDQRLVYSSDLEGRYEFYDDPTGSLFSLPLMEFLGRDDKVFLNTKRWIESPGNTYYIHGRYPGLSNVHVKHPWSFYLYWKKMLGDDVEIPSMDSGLSCETYDENTGMCATGIHFPGASCVRALSSMGDVQLDDHRRFKHILGFTLFIPEDKE